MNLKKVAFADFAKSSTGTNCIHYCSSAYFFFLTLSVLIACNFFVYPLLFKDSETWLGNVLLLHYIFLNIIGNYLLGVKCSSFVSADMVLCDPPKSWHFCFLCNHHSPPRSHHCSLCNACVLKRDHHCFFFCQCVGLKNQKYFIMFTFYVAVGSIYAIKMILSYLDVTYVPLQLTYRSIFSYIFPVMFYHWRFSEDVNVTFTTVFCMLVLYGCFSTSTGCLLLFVSQCLFVIRGQTQYEFFKNQKPFPKSVLQRVIDVFGPLWALHLVFPLPLRTTTEKEWLPSYKNV